MEEIAFVDSSGNRLLFSENGVHVNGDLQTSLGEVDAHDGLLALDYYDEETRERYF